MVSQPVWLRGRARRNGVHANLRTGPMNGDAKAPLQPQKQSSQPTAWTCARAGHTVRETATPRGHRVGSFGEGNGRRASSTSPMTPHRHILSAPTRMPNAQPECALPSCAPGAHGGRAAYGGPGVGWGGPGSGGAHGADGGGRGAGSWVVGRARRWRWWRR